MANAKRKMKNHALLQAMKNSPEPVVDQENVKSSLGLALNYYSCNHSSKDYKNFTMLYYKKRDKNIHALLSKLPDSRFQTFGAICRLLDREVYDLNWYPESQWFQTKLQELLALGNKVQIEEDNAPQDDKPVVKVISIQERINAKVSEIAAEIDGAIDEYTTSGGKTDFSAKSLLLSSTATPPIAKRIGEFYKPVSAELHEAIAGTCEQLNEGYSHYTKRGLKKFAEFIDQIIADCEQQVQTAKVNRAPRRKKAVPPTKQVARVKYMKEFAEINLKSIQPVNMLESNEIWIYNTKYRRITRYTAVSGVLGIKGTTIVGFDTATSVTFTLRKPEEFFKGLSIGKRALNTAVKSIKTKPAKPNGRINEDCIILGGF